jgi:hypothetical protein
MRRQGMRIELQLGNIGNILGKLPLGTPRRWEDNIKMDIWEIGREDGRWMEVTHFLFDGNVRYYL